MASVPALDDWQVIGRLVVAAALGGAIGVEREIRDREAGIRTHLLVALGAGLFTIVSGYGFHAFLASGDTVVSADPTRIAAQIVTGIGFLGAGAIIREGLSVRGLTTAGSLWVSAAIGMASGVGWYWPAVVTTLLTIFALWPLRLFAYRVIERVKPEENRLTVELRAGQPVGPLLAQFDDVRHFELAEEIDRRVVQIELPQIDEELVARLSDLEYVIGVRWRR
ncbi:MAG TPA: MgtC/SapB family protein [Gaiellaceae bacterium]|nr:MgtC/SapB family protein [Gaiellaceae bacterium]